MIVHLGIDLENMLQQARIARKTRPLIAEVAEIVDGAVARARGHWPDPAEREAAGFGALAAAACFGEVAQDGPQAMMLNLVGLFGQSLIEDARHGGGR